jgi:hypothetical protein
MGLRVRYYLDGIEINPPNNYMGLEIELNYDADQNKQALSVNQWEFGVGDPSKGNDGMIMARNQFRDQTGVGVVQGKPYKITIDDEKGKTYTLFDGYIDLWKAKYQRGKITADSVQAGGIDWINDYSDSFTFDYLYQQGFFDKSRFVNVPYIIVKKQDSFEIIMTSVTIFVIVDKLKAQVKEISQLIASCTNPLELSAIPRFVLEILYTTSLFVSLVVLIVKLIYMLMPPVKYHKGMFVKDLCEIACAYMGFTFKSSILQQPPFDKLFILPEKFNVTENKNGAFAGVAGDFKNNNEKTGHFKGTFGDLIRMMKTMFYGKILIDGNTKTLYFEKYDFVIGNSGINVPYSFENEETFSLNYDEFYATMILSFLVDLNDRSTIQEYLGTAVQVTQTAKGTIDQQMSLLRNLKEEKIQFALAKRKTELTFIEKIVSDFLKAIQFLMDALLLVINTAIAAINVLISVVNKIIKALKTIGIKIGKPISKIPTINPPQIGGVIDNRIGMLKMESDYISVAKIMLLDQSSHDVNTKPHSDNEALVNARYLFENYHYFKSFVSINGKEDNQHYLRDSDRFPFSFADYEQSLHNNIIFTPDGLSGRCLSLKFNPQTQTATCSYKQRKHYLSNLKLDIYEPDGQ